MEDGILPVILLLIILFLVGCYIGDGTGTKRATEAMERQAVLLGYGKYAVDKESVKFEWNKPVEKQETK